MTPDRPRSVLLLAGTTEATDLAGMLATEPRVAVTASFAGRIIGASPERLDLPCPVRIGEFGGVDGLVAELQQGGYDLLVDATHPFAAEISSHAAAAAEVTGTAHLRLERPPWEPGPGDCWVEVEDMAAAAAAVRALGAERVLLAVGRRGLEPFRWLAGTRCWVRSIEPVPLKDWPDAVAIAARPPFSEESERALLSEHGIEAVVTKNSGGSATEAKLAAARTLGVPVVMIRRPLPTWTGPQVATAADARDVVRALLR